MKMQMVIVVEKNKEEWIGLEGESEKDIFHKAEDIIDKRYKNTGDKKWDLLGNRKHTRVKYMKMSDIPRRFIESIVESSKLNADGRSQLTKSLYLGQKEYPCLRNKKDKRSKCKINNKVAWLFETKTPIDNKRTYRNVS